MDGGQTFWGGEVKGRRGKEDGCTILKEDIIVGQCMGGWRQEKGVSYVAWLQSG